MLDQTMTASQSSVSQRMHAVQTPVIPTVAALIAANPGTISLGQGIAHYPPPKQVNDALANFYQQVGVHSYKAVTGTASLKEKITQKLADDNGVDVPPERIVVTAGANMAFNNALLAIADADDDIILLTPYYFNHEMAITMANCRTVVVPTDENYQPDVAAISAAITPKTKAVVTVSPNNPTGAVYAAEALNAINKLCADHGIYHISDETYEYFTYDGARHVTPLSFEDAADHTISIYSLSKAYGFASWRIGYMVIPETLIPAVEKIQDTILICPPVVSQVAAEAALAVGRAYCTPYVEAYAEVRKLVLDELASIPDIVTVPRPDGAFYCFLKVNLPLAPMDLCQRLIEQASVAVIPGDTFGTSGCYVRISYGALEHADVGEGIGRLVTGLREIAASV
ncbi:MAG: pyridoxal phosphate-dependent aminotransferase [Deinococcota bacterium]